MKINFENAQKNNLIEYTKFILLGVLFLIIHLFVINYFEIFGVVPDILLFLGVWITIKEGRFVGLIYIFLVGLLFDVINNEYYGLSSLAKISAIFFAGTFYEEDKSILVLSNFKFVVIVFFSSIINNIIFYLFDFRITNYDFVTYLIYFVIANAFYTSILSMSIVVYYSNKRF